MKCNNILYIFRYYSVERAKLYTNEFEIYIYVFISIYIGVHGSFCYRRRMCVYLFLLMCLRVL